MDPVTLIVGALVAGVTTGLGEAAATAVKDAYAGLKRLVADRLRGHPAGEVALEEHEKDPDTWAKPLEKAVAEAGVADDPQIIEAAQRLMALVDEAGSQAGKYTVDLRGAQGVQVGDRNRQDNIFNAPPPAT